MFGFSSKSGAQTRSVAILRALESDGLPSATDAQRMGVAESRGNYAGRKVTYVRVFDPRQLAAHAIDASTSHVYRDLDARPDLVLRAGFVEENGTVVMYTDQPASHSKVSSREAANRADHADVERFIAPDQVR